MTRTRVFLPASLAAALAAGILAIGSCSDDPVAPPLGPGAIGPEGGRVEIQHGSFAGLTVEVAPGAWEERWEVALLTETTFTTPDFPEGLEGYDGAATGSLQMRIGRVGADGAWIAAPDSLPLTITFPRGDVAAEGTEALVAFRWDEDAGLWRLAAPARLDGSRLVVRTHRHLPLWTWGKVDVAEADHATYVEPAMQDLVGRGTWNDVAQTLQDLHDAVVPGPLAITCENLWAVRDALVGIRDQAAVPLRAHQDGLAGACGDCDVTSGEFYDLLIENLSLRVQMFVTELFLVEASPHWLASVFGQVMIMSYAGALENQPCDFECFFGRGTGDFYANYAVYGVTVCAIAMIDYFVWAGYIDC